MSNKSAKDFDDKVLRPCTATLYANDGSNYVLGIVHHDAPHLYNHDIPFVCPCPLVGSSVSISIAVCKYSIIDSISRSLRISKWGLGTEISVSSRSSYLSSAWANSMTVIRSRHLITVIVSICTSEFTLESVNAFRRARIEAIRTCFAPFSFANELRRRSQMDWTVAVKKMSLRH